MELSIDAVLQTASDKAFRERALGEHKTIAAWTSDRIDLRKAKILDFGCGQGIAAASFALRNRGSKVVGLDVAPVDERGLDGLLRKNIELSLPDNLRFARIGDGALLDEGDFDLIYAWSVFEHISETSMVATFKELKHRLRKGGLLFLHSNPLYFSPTGSHLYRYFNKPWHHLILPLDVLRDGVFAHGIADTPSREWQQFLALNRLTARDILGRASSAGLKRIREQLATTDLTPPPLLARVYSHEALSTYEVKALFD